MAHLIYSLFIGILFINCNNSALKINTTNPNSNVFTKSDITLQDTLDFVNMIQTNYSIGSKQWRSEVNVPVVYDNVIFQKPVLAFKNNGETSSVRFNKPVVFIDCTFKDVVDMRQCIFEDVVSFINCDFESDVKITNSTFRSPINFEGSDFDSEFYSQNSIFHEKVNFSNTYFAKSSIFQGSKWHDDVSFINSKSFGYFDLSICRFDGYFIANYMKCYDRTVVSQTRFNNRMEWLGVQFNELTFKDSFMMGPSTFEGASVSKDIFDNDNYFVSKTALPTLSKD